MDLIRNLYLHKYSHKMFYKTKPPSRSTSGSSSVPNADNLRSQQFYIYTIDQRGSRNIPAVMDLPPKYEDVVKEPQPPPYSQQC